jgi:hypothetical protein
VHAEGVVTDGSSTITWILNLIVMDVLKTCIRLKGGTQLFLPVFGSEHICTQCALVFVQTPSETDGSPFTMPLFLSVARCLVVPGQ